jgi:hypothetical protein
MGTVITPPAADSRKGRRSASAWMQISRSIYSACSGRIDPGHEAGNQYSEYRERNCVDDAHASMTVHQWFTSLDGAGGFVIVETDNPADLVTAASAFGPFYDFQIHPVIDFAEAVPAVQKGMEYRNSIS